MVKCIHYRPTSCLNLNSVGKLLKKSMQQVLGTKAKQIFLIPAITLKICQKHRDSTSHIERSTVNVLGEGPTKITKTNASIDKQITLKRDYIYKIENKVLEIGVSGVILRILFYTMHNKFSNFLCFASFFVLVFVQCL